MAAARRPVVEFALRENFGCQRRVGDQVSDEIVTEAPGLCLGFTKVKYQETCRRSGFIQVLSKEVESDSHCHATATLHSATLNHITEVCIITGDARISVEMEMKIVLILADIPRLYRGIKISSEGDVGRYRSL